MSSEQPTTHHQHPADVTKDNLDIRPYFYALWGGRLIVLALVLAGALLGYASTFLQPTLYQGRVMLLVSQSKMGAEAMPMTFPAGFSMLLTNASLLDGLIRDLKLDQPPYRMTTRKLFRRLTIEDIRGAPLVRATVLLEDPQMAASVANEFARRAVELNRSINQHDTIQGRDLIKSQLDQAKDRLGRTEEELLGFKQKSQVELTKKDVDALLDKRGELLELRVDIEGERSKLAEAEKQRQNTERLLPGERQPLVEMDLQRATTPTPLPAERRGPNGAIKEDDPRLAREQRIASQTPALPLGSGIVNPVWQLLDYQIATSRNRLQALERERQLLQTDLKLDSVRMGKLDQVYQAEIQIARLELERQIAAKIYGDLSAEYEAARLKVASRSAELQVVDPAIPATEPSSPRRLFAMAIGSVLGVMLALSGLSLRYALSDAN